MVIWEHGVAMARECGVAVTVDFGEPSCTAQQLVCLPWPRAKAKDGCCIGSGDLSIFRVLRQPPIT